MPRGSLALSVILAVGTSCTVLTDPNQFKGTGLADSGTDADAAADSADAQTGGDAGAACDLSNPCASGYVCRREDLPLRRCSERGVCEAEPASCSGTTFVCGCDDRVYANDCERTAVGVGASNIIVNPENGEFCIPEQTFCGSNNDCDVESYCAKRECSDDAGVCVVGRTPRCP